MTNRKPLLKRLIMPDLYPAPAAGAAVQSVELSVFADQKSRTNTNTGHGEMAEEAITLLDNLSGFDAEVTGRDNAKDGPDRRVGDTFIQTKYYTTARNSMEACFDEETGLYRYIRDGKPMQLEVPADQYDRVVTLFAKKIEAGLVPGVSDPADAANIIRPGRLTYQQAVNLTTPFTAESIAYDAATGALVSLCAMVISFIAAGTSALLRTGSPKKAFKAGLAGAGQGAGRAFGQHLLISQLARTDLAASVLPAAEAAVDPLAGNLVNTVTSALRGLNGKVAVAGATAEKQLARMLRTSLLTSGIILILLTLPDVFRLIARRVSCGQFIRNLLCRIASLAGGTIGAVAAGLLPLAGSSPVLGTVVAMGGAFLGGTALAWLVNTVFRFFHEDDLTRAIRQLNDAAASMAADSQLTEREAAALSGRFRRMTTRELRRTLVPVCRGRNSDDALRKFLQPHFDAVTGSRVVGEFSLNVPDIG